MTIWPVYGRIAGPIVMIGFGSIGRGTLPLIERDLGELQRQLKTVHGQVQAVMNDPRRTSTEPSGGLGDVIDMTLELITLVIQRIKQSRN